MSDNKHLNKMRLPEAYPHACFNSAPFEPVPLASSADPNAVFRTHLKRSDPGKSSRSFRLMLVTRPHRRAMLQQLWCASAEEAGVILCTVAHPDVVGVREQWTRLVFKSPSGKQKSTLVDLLGQKRDGSRVLISVKYASKARCPIYRAEIANIAEQAITDPNTTFTVASRQCFGETFRGKADLVHRMRLRWDPEADDAVLNDVLRQTSPQPIGEYLNSSKLGYARAYRAIARLIGDGDIGIDLHMPIQDSTSCWGMAA